MRIYYEVLIAGILVLLAVFLSLTRIFDIKNTPTRKAVGLFSGAMGLLTYVWLHEHPDLLEEFVAKIVLTGLGVAIALLALAKKGIR